MIAVPYLTIGTGGFYVYRLAKKHRQTLDTSAGACDPDSLNSGVNKS